MQKETIGTLAAVMTAIISGFSIFANKIFIVDLDATVFTAVRALIIGVAFFFIAYWKGDWGKKAGKAGKINWKYLVAIGVIGGGLAFLLFFSGLQLTTSGRGAFLHKTLPLYTTVLAFVFLKEKVSQKQGIALLAMLLGTLMLYMASIPADKLWSAPQLGDSLVIIAAALWGVENVLAKKAMLNGSSNFVVSFGRMFIGAIFLFGVLVSFGNLGALLELSAAQAVNIAVSTGLLFCYVFFYYWSVKLINVSKASSILLAAPIITLFIGSLVLGEPAPLLQLVGSGVILAGAAVMAKSRSEFREGV